MIKYVLNEVILRLMSSKKFICYARMRTSVYLSRAVFSNMGVDPLTWHRKIFIQSSKWRSIKCMAAMNSAATKT